MVSDFMENSHWIRSIWMEIEWMACLAALMTQTGIRFKMHSADDKQTTMASTDAPEQLFKSCTTNERRFKFATVFSSEIPN